MQTAHFYDRFKADGYLKPETSPAMYQRLQHTVRIVITFWNAQQEVLPRVSSASPPSLSTYVGELLIPHMTDLLAIDRLPEVGIHSYKALEKAVDPTRLKMVNFDTERTGFTFSDILLGHLVIGIWYWCTDQTIVQRVLGAQSEQQAKLGALLAGFLKILPVFLMIVPGVLAFALFHNQVGGNTKNVLPVMIIELMPVGLRGLMIAALLAAVMSSVAAALTSCSTLVVYDVFEQLRPGLTDAAKIRIGRITGVVVLGLATVWSPFLGNLGAIFEVINQLFTIFAPSIVAVFLGDILSESSSVSYDAHTMFY